MPTRKVQFVNDEFYHVFNRGVEERKIFLDDEDKLRFVNSLLVFNDANPASWNMRSFWYQRGPTSLIGVYKPEDPLVEIHSFALMDNHFHLLLKQIKERGVSIFMQKLGGYSYYFNKKYKRVGSLFQGKFKAVLIRTDKQLKNAFVYVNTNPVGLIEPNWKEKGIKDFKKSTRFLKEYKWSSCPDYLTEANNYSFIEKEFFLKLFRGTQGCREEVESWLKYKVEFNKFKDIALE
ncbi:MAG: transposase [Patescibacteria group bacterium]